MDILDRFKTELFQKLENNNPIHFRKVFLEFDNYVVSLSPDTTDRKYLKSFFAIYQDLYAYVLLHKKVDFYRIILKSKNNLLNLPTRVEQNLIISAIHMNINSLLDFYSQQLLYTFFEHLNHVEKENKANLVIIGLAYLFSKDINSLPDKNILKHTLIRFKMHETYYHFLIKLLHDFYGNEFFEKEETIQKLVYTFSIIPNKADEVICSMAQLAIERESVPLFKAISKALDLSNITSQDNPLKSDLLKAYLNGFNNNKGNVKALIFLHKTLITNDKSEVEDV